MNKLTLSKDEIFEKFGKNKEHAKQVEQYAEKIFDAMNGKIIHLGAREKEYLKAAAFLHDIGYHIEKKAHHKHTLKLILEHGLEGFNEDEIQIIANIARYHRASFPNEEKHEHFIKLTSSQKELVKQLGAILRIADGMDKPSKNLILRIEIQETGESIDFYVKTIGFKPKLSMAKEKSDLFEEVFKKPVKFVFM